MKTFYIVAQRLSSNRQHDDEYLDRDKNLGSRKPDSQVSTEPPKN